MSDRYFIRAIWDPEAKVYYSDSNVPGLVVESESLAEFVSIAEELLPEMLEGNLGETLSEGRHLVSGAFEIAV